jgi:hypothetical protein
MSYHQAHLAWQQRVNIEKHQNRKYVILTDFTTRVLTLLVGL